MSTKDISDEMVVAAYAEAKALPHVFADAVLETRTGQPPKVVFRAMERACNHGLIEYGVSLRAGWLTDKGQQLLRAN